MKKKLSLLVLECPWSEDLGDAQSVRPFMQGWADLNNIAISYKMYYSAVDLTMWLRRFITHKEIDICYIAGHGRGGRLSGNLKGINMNKLARSTSRKGPGGHDKKGILLGACDVGKNLKEFMAGCGSRVSWVAGYDREIPWLEGTITDLLFLQYKLIGRIRIGRDGEFKENKDRDFVSMKSGRASMIVKWIYEDFPLAEKCGFQAIDRR